MIEALKRIDEWPAAARVHWLRCSAARWRPGWGSSIGMPALPVLMVWWPVIFVAMFALLKFKPLALVGAAIALVFWLTPPIARKAVIPLAVMALALLYPQYLVHLPSMRLFGAFPGLDTAVTMLAFMMMAVGLNIVVGYAGLLDLGYVAFYAIGAYTAAWLASPQFNVDFSFGAVGVTEGLGGIHISIWIVLVAAACLTAVIGIIIGLPTLRLRGDYLAIVTLGFGEILHQAPQNADNLGGFNLTNGAQGINPVDAAGFGHGLHQLLGVPSAYISDPNATKWHYWTLLVLLILTAFASIRLRDSRLGRAWIAIREDEVAAAAMGIPLMRTKTWAYACGAFFGGIAGAYYASYKGAVYPDDFQFYISIFVLSMVILGGMGNVWGVIAGGAFLAFLNYAGLGQMSASINSTFNTNIDLTAYNGGIFGAILVIVMLLRPEGLIPSSRRRAELHEGVHDEPLVDVQQ